MVRTHPVKTYTLCVSDEVLGCSFIVAATAAAYYRVFVQSSGMPLAEIMTLTVERQSRMSPPDFFAVQRK